MAFPSRRIRAGCGSKRHRRRLAPFAFGQRDAVFENHLMPSMHAVEIAQRQHGAVGVIGAGNKIADDSHLAFDGTLISASPSSTTVSLT